MSRETKNENEVMGGLVDLFISYKSGPNYGLFRSITFVMFVYCHGDSTLTFCLSSHKHSQYERLTF